MKIKERYHQFRAWQRAPHRFTIKKTGEQQCACCGHKYEGNYCPVCGQAAGDGRLTWRWVWKNIMLLWGMDSRSMPYTLWQLLLRPGYLIGEYISGHRQVCYPPIKMLFIVVILYAILKQLLGIKTPEVNLGPNPDTNLVIIDWLIRHAGWGMIAMSIFMILPTWIFFRFAPRHTRHRLPDGIFIQLLLCSLMMLIIILTRCISGWMLLLIPFYFYLTYRQLFGYGVWGTLWRTFLCLLIWGLSLFLIVALVSTFGYGFDLTSFKTTCILLVAISTILGGGYWISKKNRCLQHTDKQ